MVFLHLLHLVTPDFFVLVSKFLSSYAENIGETCRFLQGGGVIWAGSVKSSLEEKERALYTEKKNSVTVWGWKRKKKKNEQYQKTIEMFINFIHTVFISLMSGYYLKIYFYLPQWPKNAFDSWEKLFYSLLLIFPSFKSRIQWLIYSF